MVFYGYWQTTKTKNNVVLIASLDEFAAKVGVRADQGGRGKVVLHTTWIPYERTYKSWGPGCIMYYFHWVKNPTLYVKNLTLTSI